MTKFNIISATNNKDLVNATLPFNFKDNNILFNNINTILNINGNLYDVDKYRVALFAGDNSSIILFSDDYNLVKNKLNKLGMYFHEINLQDRKDLLPEYIDFEELEKREYKDLEFADSVRNLNYYVSKREKDFSAHEIVGNISIVITNEDFTNSLYRKSITKVFDYDDTDILVSKDLEKRKALSKTLRRKDKHNNKKLQLVR